MQTRKATRPKGVDRSRLMPPPGLHIYLWPRDLDLWPPDPQSWPFHALGAWTVCVIFKISRSRVWQQMNEWMNNVTAEPTRAIKIYRHFWRKEISVGKRSYTNAVYHWLATCKNGTWYLAPCLPFQHKLTTFKKKFVTLMQTTLANNCRKILH